MHTLSFHYFIRFLKIEIFSDFLRVHAGVNKVVKSPNGTHNKDLNASNHARAIVNKCECFTLTFSSFSCSETCNYFLDKVPYPNGSQPNLVHSMPAMPLKSPFEEIMNRQQYFANASNAAVPLSIANVRTANVLNEVAIEKTVNATQPDATVRPASSSSRSQSTECLYSQEYRKFYNKIVVWCFYVSSLYTL